MSAGPVRPRQLRAQLGFGLLTRGFDFGLEVGGALYAVDARKGGQVYFAWNQGYFSAGEIKNDLTGRRITKEVRCGACRQVNKVREPYCAKCGQPLTLPMPPCHHCGKTNRMGSRFCIHCGHRLR